MPGPAPLPWPDQWYENHYDIRCIVPHCTFVTDIENLKAQWTQLHDHCMQTPGAEHALLEIMLRQRMCAFCNNGGPYYGEKHRAIRSLFDHEGNVHGTAEMFNISSFVALVRRQRILFSNGAHMVPERHSGRFAFDRMMEKVQALPAADLRLVFQKSGFRPGEYTPGNLKGILTYDPAVQPPPHAPHWLPLRADRFLLFCRPRVNNPADDDWRQVWENLRERYAHGSI